MDVRKVVVIGAGLAGLSCSLTLARAGVASVLVSALPSERAQSVMAEGGINAALDLMGQHDTPRDHFADTIRGGCYLADPNAVWGMVQEAPRIVADLQALGVPFNTEHGRMVQRAFGGQKKIRTAFAKSSTGKALVTAMIDAVRRYEAKGYVQRMSHHVLSGLAIADGACTGAWVSDAYTGAVTWLSGPVVLAAGGLSGIFGALTTGTTVNTGDVAALAFDAGVELSNLEFVQYHPTTVPITGKRMLVSEAARGEGGRLFAQRGGEPWYFMEERYPELGNLMPRDVVSREEARVMADPATTGKIWLDLRGISRTVWRSRLSDLREECVHYLGIDPAKSPVPVEPGIHYSMGGVLVDEAHRTNIAGLYAAGECCSQYHGANRLGGNSLLGALYGGRVVARTLLAGDAGDLMGWDTTAEPLADKDVSVQGDPSLPIASDRAADEAIRATLAASLGVMRDGDSLAQARETLERLDTTGCSDRLVRRRSLAQAMVACAAARQESRGAHWRTDCPQTREEFARMTVVLRGENAPEVSFRTIPTPRTQDGCPDLHEGVSA